MYAEVGSGMDSEADVEEAVEKVDGRRARGVRLSELGSCRVQETVLRQREESSMCSGYRPWNVDQLSCAETTGMTL